MTSRSRARVLLALVGLAVAVVSAIYAMVCSPRIFSEKTVMGGVYVFRNTKSNAWVLAYDLKRAYWEGSRAASIGVRLLEVLGRGSFLPAQEFTEMELIFPLEPDNCCGWFVIPGETAYSLFPIGSGLLLMNVSDQSFHQWTGLGFLPCPDIGPFRQTEDGSYLSEERQYSDWEQTELRVDWGGRQEHRLGDFSIVLEWMVDPGWLTTRGWLELRITRGDELVILRKDSFSHWARSAEPPEILPPAFAKWPESLPTVKQSED